MTLICGGKKNRRPDPHFIGATVNYKRHIYIHGEEKFEWGGPREEVQPQKKDRRMQKAFVFMK